ncbi:T9SS type A sorting domain-containing protein [Hymenobacter sp. BT175]|uniref:Kelch repeat-containing protein n=1 Tax=Hymenobacter translucens TaxID=2886507 RepID=UPI001D0EE88C|nr:kelch repeat-containing protein [Hymenobacter translucens]MCC2545706.1 T9SS type A sorting domain-containing protein [Hymenobacter translucens]
MRKLLLSVPLLAFACLSWLPVRAQSTLTFTSLPPMPSPHYGMGYCIYQSGLYSIGGGTTFGPLTADVFRFDLQQNRWDVGLGAPTPQRFTTAAVVEPNVIYVLNGATTTANGVTPVVETVLMQGGSSGPSFANPSPTASAGSAVWNGLLYCYGGSVGTAFSNSLRSYNRATNTWTNLAPMPEAKQTFGAAVNGKIYTFGGYNGVVNSSRIDVYDIATNQWTALGNLPTTVSNQAVAVQGEWIWLVGDFTNQSFLAAYNTRTAQLRTFSSNLPPRRNAAAAIAAAGNQLYVWGGNTASAGSATLGDLWRADVSFLVTGTRPAAAPALLQAYPNPSASGRFTVLRPAGATELLVTDAVGREVLRQPLTGAATEAQLDLTAQPAGLYLVRMSTPGQPSAQCRVVRQ